jgi:hypothetical protein
MDPGQAKAMRAVGKHVHGMETWLAASAYAIWPCGDA